MIDIARKSSELKQFASTILDKAVVKISKVTIKNQDAWSLTDGVFSHKSRGFFHVAAAINQSTKEEEIVYYQPHSALTGLALTRKEGTVFCLLQARIEPGNPNWLQWAPTIQSTAANYMRMHGGKSTNYLSFFQDYASEVQPLGHSYQFDLGKRYYQKNKWHHYVELTDFCPTEENMIWCSMDVIQELLFEDETINPDLRSLLVTFDWDRFTCNSILHFPSVQERISSVPDKGNWRLCSLHDLQKWEVNEYGVFPLDEEAVSIEFFKFHAASREVSTWTQPLMVSRDQGLTQLVCRKFDGQMEFLLTFGHELGLSSGPAFLPSYLKYPSEQKKASPFDHLKGDRIRITQSDEGGRFYRNTSVFEVIFTEEEVEAGTNQLWLTAEEFKSVLCSSSKAVIQLRCIASLVFTHLNPLFSS